MFADSSRLENSGHFDALAIRQPTPPQHVSSSDDENREAETVEEPPHNRTRVPLAGSVFDVTEVATRRVRHGR